MWKTLAIFLIWQLVNPLPASARELETPAGEIVRQYLEMPHPEVRDLGKSRGKRLAVLRKLQTIPAEAVLAISYTLPRVSSPVQRSELVEALGHVHTQGSAVVLVSAMNDPESRVRRAAVFALRRLSSRIDRRGLKRAARDPEYAPSVEGLVPFLRAALDDDDDGVRRSAMFALADTREPEAAAEFCNLLEDEDEQIQLLAAYFLSEFGEDSGLPELLVALQRLRAKPRTDRDLRRYQEAEMVLLGFERLTGESQGEVPTHPMLLSSSSSIEETKLCFEELLAAWEQWWAEKDESER